MSVESDTAANAAGAVPTRSSSDYVVWHTLPGGVIFLVVMLAECVYACIVLGGPSAGRSRYTYTLKRLRVSERRLFIDYCVFNIFVFLLIWASMSCAALIAGNVLNAAGAFGTGPQSFYTNYMLNGSLQLLVPMDDPWPAISMILILISMGVFAAGDLISGKLGSVFTIIYAAAYFYLISLRAGDYGFMVLLIVSILAFMFAVGVFVFKMSDLSRGANVEVDDGR